MSNVTNKEIVIVDENNIKDKIYLIRGQKVMLDFDLAEIYGYETRKLNEQVKTNIERFVPDFMFQLKKVNGNQFCGRKIGPQKLYLLKEDIYLMLLPNKAFICL